MQRPIAEYGPEGGQQAAPAARAEEEEEEDDFDLFGDDDEEEVSCVGVEIRAGCWPISQQNSLCMP